MLPFFALGCRNPKLPPQGRCAKTAKSGGSFLGGGKSHGMFRSCLCGCWRWQTRSRLPWPSCLSGSMDRGGCTYYLPQMMGSQH